MCGFAGIIDLDRRTSEQAIRAIVARMVNTLRHRGPDDAGIWVDAAAGVALGHRRLSILDLFNGEIYNSQQLRRELDRVTIGSLSFRGHSDTEVMLAAFEHWGVQRAISRMNGMFAFALWDRHERVLYLGRDRLGEKPVYYGWTGKTFLFGSELKALRCHPDFTAGINRQALALYLRHNCIPAPHTIYEGVYKLPPATILAVSLMQAQSERPVKTFTIGSCEPDYDEAGDARAVARHLGTEHTELYVTPAEAMAVIPRLPEIYDEPFADSSQIVTFLVAQLARHYVTVALSGDGGDEVFGGYNRHVWSARIWKSIRWAPRSARTAAARAIRQIPTHRWETLFHSLNRVLPRSLIHRQFGYKLHKLAGILPACSPQAMYFALASHWLEPESVVLAAKEPETLLTRADPWPRLPEFSQQMMFLDAATYLPDDILTKVDRATMAVSLEARVPLLDHRVVEFAWRLPSSLKIRNGQGKWVLRQLLQRYVPPQLIDRPKLGFGIPLDTWLRGPLRDWAESLLDENRLRNEGFFNPQPVREYWKHHLTGSCDLQYHLWDVLIFQAWYSSQRQAKPELESIPAAAS